MPCEYWMSYFDIKQQLNFYLFLFFVTLLCNDLYHEKRYTNKFELNLIEF